MCTPGFFLKKCLCSKSVDLKYIFKKMLKSFNVFTSHFNHPFQPLDFVSTKSQILPYEH